GVNPAFADMDGAIAAYLSAHPPTGVSGIVAKTARFPAQSTTLSMFWLQYSVTSIAPGAVGTPTELVTEVKGVGLAASKIPVSPNNPAIVRVICVFLFIFRSLVF